MIIHLIRHAEAVDRSQDIPEEHRFLTPRGIKRFRKVARSLKKLGLEPDVILTSPMIRAVQTADILSETLRHKGDLLVVPQLAARFGPEQLDELLNSYPQAREIVLIGHEPDLGALTQNMLEAQASCALCKGGGASFKRSAGGEALFIQLVTGGGRIFTSRSKALERLQRETTK